MCVLINSHVDISLFLKLLNRKWEKKMMHIVMLYLPGKKLSSATSCTQQLPNIANTWCLFLDGLASLAKSMLAWLK